MNKTTKILTAALVIVAVGCAAFVFRPAPVQTQPVTEPANGDAENTSAQQTPETATETWAQIWVNDRVVCEINLDIVQDQILPLQERTGKQIDLEIKDHAVRFASSDCPDQICVHAGYQRRDLDIASCLPNRVIITVEDRTAGK